MKRKKSGRANVFHFNHIDPELQGETLKELKELYKFYHRLWFCYKERHRKHKRSLLAINFPSVGLVVMGRTAGAVTLNPVVLGVVSGAAVLMKTAAEIKNYPSKIERAKFAFTSYEKPLTETRSFLRGESYESEAFIQKMKALDEIIIDLSLDWEKYAKKYEKTFQRK